mmetsp:Transcript_3517/g.8108  ORF Transcript_3517/g.8108 Transcript_3517/m.8108 type:complete len:110 (+) Transcript_3517:420-749(+)
MFRRFRKGYGVPMVPVPHLPIIWHLDYLQRILQFPGQSRVVASELQRGGWKLAEKDMNLQKYNKAILQEVERRTVRDFKKLRKVTKERCPEAWKNSKAQREFFSKLYQQ